MIKSLDSNRDSNIIPKSISDTGSLVWLHQNPSLYTQVQELYKTKTASPFFFKDIELLSLDKVCHLIILSIDKQSLKQISKQIDFVFRKKKNAEILLHLNSEQQDINQQIESTYSNQDRIHFIDQLATPRELLILIPVLISKAKLRNSQNQEQNGNYLSLKVNNKENKELSSLVACGMAHDVNNILTAIQGRVWYLEKIASTQDHDNYSISPKQAFLDVSRWILKIKSLLKQLIVMTKDQAFAQRQVDLNEILKSSMELANSLICESVKVTLRLPEQKTLSMGDSTLLEQVILNLCINAKNAIFTNGLLDVKLTQNIKFNNTYYHQIQLKDNGKGISSTNLDSIFDPFFSTSKNSKGQGLGLFMCKQIVEKHDGFIQVHSIINEGSTFTINLPVSNNNQLEKRIS